MKSCLWMECLASIEPTGFPESKNAAETVMTGRVTEKSFFMTIVPAAVRMVLSSRSPSSEGCEMISNNLTCSNSHRSGRTWMIFSMVFARQAVSILRDSCSAYTDKPKYKKGIAIAKMKATKPPRMRMSLVTDQSDCRRRKLKGTIHSLSGHSRQSHMAVFREKLPAILGKNKVYKVFHGTLILIPLVDQRQCHGIGVLAGGNIWQCRGIPHPRRGP